MRTSRDFYARRGNFAYMRHMLRFKGTCLKRGDFTFSEYLISTLPHVIVCLMPNKLRELVYRRFLRGRASTGEVG